MKGRVSLFLAAYITLVSIIPSFANQLQRVQQEKNRIESQINSITSQKRQAQSNLQSALNNRAYLSQIERQQNLIYENTIRDKNLIESEIRTIEKALKEAELEYEQKMRQFETRIVHMYKNSNKSVIDILLESEGIIDFFNRYKLMNIIARKDRELIEEISALKKDIEYKKQIKDQEQQELQRKANMSLNEINTIQASRSNVDRQIQNVNSQIEQLRRQEDELLRKSEELVREIQRLQSSSGNYSGESMVWPTPSTRTVSSPYGMRYHPVLGTNRMHTGIDIAAGAGQSIVAANSGTVIVSGWQGGYGYTVIIDHGGGITTLYAHASQLLVSVGQRVQKGQTIARVGSTGLSTGPHLHFEIRKNGATVDPLSYY